jgi:DNA replication protein DnaC
MIIGQTVTQDTIPTETRWATCSKHDEPFVEVYLPSLKMWHSSQGCGRCKIEASTGVLQPRVGQSVEEFRLQLACMPARFEGKTLKDFAGKAFKQAQEAVKNFQLSESLLIVGPFGAGKTSFGCALLRELLTQPWALELSPDVAGRYIATRDLMESLWATSQRAQWVDGAVDGVTEILKDFEEYGVLLIDDCHEVHTAEELAWLQRILAARYARKRSTILVGGPDLESLEAVLGSRTLNQLRAWKQIYLGKESV